jgi:tetratricopeptide (TPR) repeat protein
VPKSRARMESRYRRALRLAALAGVTGFGAGMIITAVAGALGGTFLLWIPLFFSAVCAVAGYLIGAFIVEGAGDLAGRIYGGGHVGTKREYSRAQALAMRGEYRAAVAEYEAAAEEFPEDPEPLILGARVLRDGLKDLEAAAEWLRRARDRPRLQPSADITIARELVDLYDGPLETPEKALPELARIAATYPGTTAGEWAGRQLARLRTKVWETVKEVEEAPAPERPTPPNPDPTI